MIVLVDKKLLCQQKTSFLQTKYNTTKTHQIRHPRRTKKKRQKLLRLIPGGHDYDYDWLTHKLFGGDPPEEEENEWGIRL